MTNTAADSMAGRVAEKEKVEKRRALGRGLESLLPGPRVVRAGAAAVAPSSMLRAPAPARLRPGCSAGSE